MLKNRHIIHIGLFFMQISFMTIKYLFHDLDTKVLQKAMYIKNCGF